MADYTRLCNLTRNMTLSKDILLISDKAGQFQLPELKHALCWVHVERKLKQLIPNMPEEVSLLNEKTTAFWQLYQDLTQYFAKFHMLKFT